MKKILIAAALLLATPAFAQDPAPPAAAPAPEARPITLTAKEYTDIIAYLGQQPFTLAAPLMNLLVQKQQQAQGATQVKP